MMSDDGQKSMPSAVTSSDQQQEEAIEVNLDSKSSSTEGPDSSPHSNSSSPLGDVMIPAYLDHAHLTHEDEEAEGHPLLPLFSVKFSDEVSKDGDVVRYKIRVKRLAPNEEATESITIEREYDDFEFLHHVLTTHNQIVGLIVPPLPPRPAADPQAAESRSRKQFGANARAIIGDDFKYDAKNLERFLVSLLKHTTFGRDKHLEEFLVHRSPPIRAKIKRGFLAGMKESLDLRKTSGVRDADDFFQKEREWALAYGTHIREACDAFGNLMSAQLRFANQVTHLATLLNASVGGHEGANAFYNRINSRFSVCLEDTERKTMESSCENGSSTMGDYLTYWTAYVESEMAMLHRRTGLFIETENAVKALVKSKPAKAHALRKVKEEKELMLEKVSKTAELETRRFHHQRLAELKSTLIKYAEGQLKVAQDSCRDLSDSTLKLRDFPLPKVQDDSLNKPE